MEFMESVILEEDGASMVEYSLLLGFIALAAVVALSAAGVSIENIWDSIAKSLK